LKESKNAEITQEDYGEEEGKKEESLPGVNGLSVQV
jgi:hypothetical protein